MATLEQSIVLHDQFTEKLNKVNNMVQHSLTLFENLNTVMSGGFNAEANIATDGITEAIAASMQFENDFVGDVEARVNFDGSELDAVIRKTQGLQEHFSNDINAFIDVDSYEIDHAIERSNALGTTLESISAIDPSASVGRMIAPIQHTNTELERSSTLFNGIASKTDWLLGKMAALPIAGDRFKASIAANVVIWSNLHVKQSRALQLMEKIKNAASGAEVPNNRLVAIAGRLVATLTKVNTPMIRFASLAVRAGQAISRNVQQQNEMNKKLSVSERFQGRINQLTRMMKFGVAIAALNQMNNMMTKLIDKADRYISTMARLNIANDGTETLKEYSDAIMAAAMRSRTSFEDTANFISKLAINAKDAFSSNDEVIAFAELLNKAYKIGGATAAEQAGSMTQLIQALSSGVLRGEELNSVMDGAPLIIQAIQDELGVTRGELKALAEQGVLSSDVIKTAMFNAAQGINEAFETIPLTWADIMTQLNNVADAAFGPLKERFSNFINSEAFEEVVNTISQALFAIAEVASWVFNIVMAGVNWIMENINTVATFFVLLGSLLAIVGLVAALSNWQFWLLIGIIMIVASVLDAMGISAIQVAAFIAGAIVWVGTVFYDAIIFIIGLFIMFGQAVFNVFAYFWNIVASIVEFFANVWSNPVYSVQMLFYNLISNILGFLAKIADGSGGAGKALGNAFVNGANIAIRAVNKLVELINKIPGINLGHLGELANFDEGYTVGDGIRNIAESFNPGDAPDNYWTAPKMEFSDYTGYEFMANNMVNPNKAASSAYDSVLGLGDLSLKGLNEFNAKGEEESVAMDNLLAGLVGAPGNYELDGGDGAGDKLGKGKEIGDIGKIKSEVSITEDDIKLMRDIAERNFIIKYQQVTPSASVTLNGSGSTEQDAKKLLHVMEKMIEEQMGSLLLTEPG